MSWSEVFLALIALATVVMAVIQVGAVVVALRLARQAQQTIASTQRAVATVQQDVRPIIERAAVVAEEASRTAALATAQAQKIDKLVSDLSVRVDETAAVVQEAIVTPAREGIAIVAALKAGLGALRRRDLRPRHGRTVDEEDPLFIG